MRSRRQTAEWLQRIGFARSAVGLALIVAGLILWVTAITTARLPLHDLWIGVICGGAIVAAGIVLMAI